MSIRVMADVWDFGPDDPIDCAVLVCLASHANDDGKSCYPKVERIARMTRYSERTVIRSIATLEADGWLRVAHGRGRGVVSQYTVVLDRLKRCPRVTLSPEKTCQPVTLSDDKTCQPVTLSKTEKVTLTTVKGDSHDNPPAPPNRKKRQETSEEQEPAARLAPEPAPVRPEEFADLWNAHRGKLPQVLEFGDSRRKKVQARMRQGVTRERFEGAVKECAAQPFLQGANGRSWSATFDWLIENDRNLAKVLEGNYRESGGESGKNQRSSPALERERRSQEAIASARTALRRNFGFAGADEEQLPVAGGERGHGADLGRVVAQAGGAARDGPAAGRVVGPFRAL
ncbi:MAG: helix-turn-helix domain-containing protein [Acidobacteriaceae bacterium]